MRSATPVTVLFDEDCGFCRWSADRLHRWDRRGALRFAPIQVSDDLLGPVAPEDRPRSMHVVAADGTVDSGGRGLVRIAERLPWGRPAARIGARVPALADAFYGLLARRRERLGAWLGVDGCTPDRPAR